MTVDEIRSQNADLRRRLEEAEETLQAIRSGAVDAVIVEDGEAYRIYTLEGADRPYRLLIEQMQQGAATLSPDGVVTYCNLSLANLLDVPHEKLIGASLEAYVSPRWRLRYGELLRDGLASTSQGEVELERSSGAGVRSLMTFTAFRESAAAVGLLVTDLTTQNRQAELAAANEVLTETNRLKDDFLMTLSHELRTPLNAILGWSQMLCEGSLSEETQRRALEAVARNAKVQAQLVEDLLDLARLASGKLRLKADTVLLGSVIDQAVESVLLAAEAKRMTLDVSMDSDEDIIVRGDAQRLQQIVWNLLSNSIKFTPLDGRVDVTIQHDRKTATIVVKDTGQGIDPAMLPAIFQRFRQAEMSSGKQHSGLGLGLAIVQHLTEAHGGTVTADSPGDGQGATFAIRLPIQEVRRRPVPASSQTTMSADMARAHALVVDDDADGRDVLRALLEARGMMVTTVKSAEQALGALQKESFHLLLCDLHVPGLDGYALIRAVRVLPPHQGGRLPAVAVTAYAGAREHAAALEAGYNWHLSKPIQQDELVAVISDATRPTRAAVADSDR